MKPDLRLRLHATQAQPCFLAASNLAASNALALPGGNGIFTTTPTERITHYTLLRKVVCQMGALPPLETPTRKGGTLPLHGAHTAFSCYPALRLYRLSKSQRGIGVVSLTLRYPCFPFGNGLARNTHAGGQFFLRHAHGFASAQDLLPKSDPCVFHRKDCGEEKKRGGVRPPLRQARSTSAFPAHHHRTCTYFPDSVPAGVSAVGAAVPA